MLANNDTKDIAEAASHEVGHNFGLSHDGNSASTSGCSSLGYYCGHAMWAPIMGVGYQKPVVQWSKGEYTNANNTQDDLTVIANGGAPVVADEAGDTVGTAAAGIPVRAYITSADRHRHLRARDVCGNADGLGSAERRRARTWTSSSSCSTRAARSIDTADPASAFVNRDSATGLNASLTAGVASGAYYARVDGVGNGTGTTGYTDYASIGAYTLTVSGCNGLAAPAAPADLTVTTDQTGTSATVTWTAPVSDGGSSVTGYTASRAGAAPESLSPATFTKTWAGLTPGASYLFSVAATNAIGTGVAASQNVTMLVTTTPAAPVATTPGAPGIGKATKGKKGGKKTATVAWTAPATDGSSPITGYTVLIYKATGRLVRTVTGLGSSSSSYTANLRRGKYRFAVIALNALGAGPPSQQSRLVKAR